MRNIVLALVVAGLPATAAPAQQLNPHKPDKSVAADKLPPLKGAGSSNPCAAFGPGFVKVEGTDSCVKIGGATSIGAGGAR